MAQTTSINLTLSIAWWFRPAIRVLGAVEIITGWRVASNNVGALARLACRTVAG